MHVRFNEPVGSRNRWRGIRVSRAIFLVALLSTTAAAQPNTGSIFGVISDSDDTGIAHAPVRAMNLETGQDARIYSSNDGRYDIQGLPSGRYTVSVATPCCRFSPYTGDIVVLERGRAFELDITLESTDYLIGLSDDPGTLAAEVVRRRIVPDDPIPRLQGRPDLSGVWLLEDDPFPEEAAPLPWAKQVADGRDPNNLLEDPFSLCLPGELPIPGASIPIITKFVHTADLLAMLFEGPPGFRQVFLDGRSHPEQPNPSWLGHSVGGWEGDTLVVDTIGFNTNDLARNGDYPRSEMMHLEERYTRVSYGYMELRLTIDDPAVFVKPWVKNLHLDLVPQEELIEFVCENNRWIRDDER